MTARISIRWMPQLLIGAGLAVSITCASQPTPTSPTGTTETVTTTQTASTCVFNVTPTSIAVASAGGTSQVSVTVSQGTNCAWTASSADAFITIAGVASGTGAGTVNLVTAANSGIARTGTVTVAGQAVTVTQSSNASPASPCAFTVSPLSVSVASAGGTQAVTVTVTQGSNCLWTANSTSAFLSVPSGAGGAGSGAISVTIAPNYALTARSGTITIAGQSVTVNQVAGSVCATALSPSTMTISSSGGTYSVTVSAPNDCAWQLAFQGSVSFPSGNTGLGNGVIQFAVPPYMGYIGTLGSAVYVGPPTAARHQLDIYQPPFCTVDVSPSSLQNLSYTDSIHTVTITVPPGCTWHAIPNDVGWINFVGDRLNQTLSGTGSAQIRVGVYPFHTPGFGSGGVTRTQNISIENKVLTVSQISAPSVELLPQSTTVSAADQSIFLTLHPYSTLPADDCWTIQNQGQGPSSFLHVGSGGPPGYVRPVYPVCGSGPSSGDYVHIDANPDTFTRVENVIVAFGRQLVLITGTVPQTVIWQSGKVAPKFFLQPPGR